MQAVPRKQANTGKKALARILAQILMGAKKAEGVPKAWWEVFQVSTPCLIPFGKEEGRGGGRGKGSCTEMPATCQASC